jgi:hypothetical protein
MQSRAKKTIVGLEAFQSSSQDRAAYLHLYFVYRGTKHFIWNLNEPGVKIALGPRSTGGLTCYGKELNTNSMRGSIGRRL